MNFYRYPSPQSEQSLGPTSDDKTRTLTDFITIQSLNNLSSMTAVVSIIWLMLQDITPIFLGNWVPFALSFFWGCLLFYLSHEGFKDGTKKRGEILVSYALIVVNVFVLYGSVTGVTNLVSSSISSL